MHRQYDTAGESAAGSNVTINNDVGGKDNCKSQHQPCNGLNYKRHPVHILPFFLRITRAPIMDANITVASPSVSYALKSRSIAETIFAALEIVNPSVI